MSNRTFVSSFWEGIQLIPVDDTASKNEFERIENITAQDLSVANSFPAGMGRDGMIPEIPKHLHIKFDFKLVDTKNAQCGRLDYAVLQPF